ncbi:MAG: phosphatase PAP2 family protein [Lachnospiraceae bacterium]
MREFIRKYKHAIPILVYLVIYLVAFFIVEQYTKDNYHLIHMALDDRIPFLEIFVIPYLLWFPYVAGFVLYFIFLDKENYWPLFWFLVSGMTLFIIVSAVYPNGQELRPDVFPRDNIFTRVIGGLYGTDTATNILPSIHVYNSLGIQIAVMKSERLKKHRWIQIASGVLCVLIILSTMFIKQHSVVDVISAFALAVVAYLIIYVFLPRKKGNKKQAQNN